MTEKYSKEEAYNLIFNDLTDYYNNEIAKVLGIDGLKEANEHWVTEHRKNHLKEMEEMKPEIPILAKKLEYTFLQNGGFSKTIEKYGSVGAFLKEINIGSGVFDILIEYLHQKYIDEESSDERYFRLNREGKDPMDIAREELGEGHKKSDYRKASGRISKAINRYKKKFGLE